MGRFVPSARRLAAVAGAAVAGAALSVAFATPALAWNTTINGNAVCDEKTGTWNVTWTVANSERTKAKLSGVKWSPINGTIGTDLPAGGTIEGKQNGVPGTAKSASLTVTSTWLDSKGKVADKVTNSGTVQLGGECKNKVPPTSVAPTRAPSPTPSASKSSAAPVLPVTGEKTGLYAGAALGLVGAGAAFFVVARRRRYSFTTPDSE